jgi:iron complex transport system permease protein
MLSRRLYLLWLGGFFALFAVALAVTPFFGAETISVGRALESLFSGEPGIAREILVAHRLPRVLLALVAGGSLAAAGAGLQGVMRNPLADPFVLGLAGAGALGASLAIILPWSAESVFMGRSTQIMSLVGCLACLLLVRRLSRSNPGPAMTTVLLAGVTINFLCGALIMLLRYLTQPHYLAVMDRWLMGSLAVVGLEEALWIMPFAALGLALVWWAALGLNVIGFGEEYATGRGVDVGRVQTAVYYGAGLLTAVAVSAAGPIGFVGLVAPHAVRRLCGPDYRIVIPGSFLLGGAFLAVCDLAARTMAAPMEMPVGILTAVIGGPVFLKILLSSRRNEGV